MASPSKTKKKSPAPKQKRQWKRSTAEEIDLPSGNVALVKRPGMEAFLTEGLFPNSLMPIIQKAVNTGRGLPPAKIKELTDDPKMVGDMFDAMDRVVARIVLEPKVVWHKEFPLGDDGQPNLDLPPVVIEDEDRAEWLSKHKMDPDTIWTDEVFFEDKSFLFNYAVGGTRDLERFRGEAESSLASLQSVEAVAQSSE
jgi:hypothetical protein